MNNRCVDGGGVGRGINSFHERLVVRIENAISSNSSTRNSSTPPLAGGGIVDDRGRFPPEALRPKAQEATERHTILGATSRTTYNSLRSGSSSVGHSPKKTVRMTTAVTNSPNQSEQANTKPATSNHSSISSFLSALSGAAGSRSKTFSSASGFSTASFSFISSSLSSSAGKKESAASGCNSDSRTRASSISFADKTVIRNHTDSSKSNHIKLNSKVEKVLNSIPGLTLGQVQGTPTGCAHQPTTSTVGPTTATTTTTAPAAPANVPTTSCNSINSTKTIVTPAPGGPTVPQVQIQTVPSSDLNSGQCPAKPLCVEHTPQRKHSATFSSFAKRPLKLKNHSVHTLELYDTLHFKSSPAPQVIKKPLFHFLPCCVKSHNHAALLLCSKCKKEIRLEKTMGILSQDTSPVTCLPRIIIAFLNTHLINISRRLVVTLSLFFCIFRLFKWKLN